ncbi:MAG: hypothetical protein LC130_08565 [Bryobacterales bacterium]|nr:hypothetical protein [Bryobacterales bacterium]
MASRISLRANDEGLEAGAVFPKLPGVTYSDYRVTVAIFISTQCITCQQSIGDYEALRELISNTARDRALLCAVFAGEPGKSIADFGIRLPVVQVNDLNEYRVSGTPTVVAIDSNGKVRDFWIGKLSSSAKDNLIRLIKEAVNV